MSLSDESLLMDEVGRVGWTCKTFGWEGGVTVNLKPIAARCNTPETVLLPVILVLLY